MPTDEARGERRDDEDELVEREDVAVDGLVASDRGGDHERGGAEGGHRHAAPLALEVGVRGHEEERGGADGDNRVGRDDLEQHEQRGSRRSGRSG